MKHFTTRLVAIALGIAMLTGPGHLQAAEQEKEKEKKEKPPQQPKQQPPAQPGRDRPGQNRAGPDSAGQERDRQEKDRQEKARQEKDRQDKNRQEKARQDKDAQQKGGSDQNTQPKDRPEKKDRDEQKSPDLDKPRGPQPELKTKPTAGGGYEKTAPSGKVREKSEKKADGEHVQRISTTGRVEAEEVQKADGTKHKTEFDLGGKVKREEQVNKDGSKQVTNHQVDRDGKVRAQETVHYDVHQKVVSKTVIKTVNKVKIENHYDHGHYGYVYHPHFVAHSPVFVSWYDPFWYSPVGVAIYHPFYFSWGWGSFGWYHRYHGVYFSPYEVYPAPSYWVTDWLVADYVSDHYAASASAAQAREDARLAHEEAEKARRAAEQARDDAEIAEAKAAQAQAELRALNAEKKAARAEREESNAGKPNPNATPIDKETKEVLKNQIEETIKEKKDFADQSEKGSKPAIPDVSKALADPKHIYPVSKPISVISAKDSSPAGTLTEGDLLKLEPGQEATLKDATENTFVTMRVMTSKGEEGEVAAGTLISASLKDLQEFDSEFRAKLDEGLTEAEKNKDQFKQGAQKK